MMFTNSCTNMGGGTNREDACFGSGLPLPAFTGPHKCLKQYVIKAVAVIHVCKCSPAATLFSTLAVLALADMLVSAFTTAL